MIIIFKLKAIKESQSLCGELHFTDEGHGWFQIRSSTKIKYIYKIRIKVIKCVWQFPYTNEN